MPNSKLLSVSWRPFNRRGFFRLVAAAGASSWTGVSSSAAGRFSESTARETFDLLRNPPAGARPWTRWWWFGGAVTPQEITREMEFMAGAGLGGVEIQPVYPVTVDRPEIGVENTRYFSPRWFDLLRHTAREARRLGLRLSLTLGSGWPYGGPFVTQDLAARRLEVLTRDAIGPGDLRWELFTAVSGGGSVVAVVAARLDDEGNLLPGERLSLGHFVKRVETNDPELTQRVLQWAVPAGHWRVYLFVDEPTYMQVKRPTLGMEGYVLDHFNRRALDRFLKAIGDRTLRELEGLEFQPFQGVFCDSLEVYGADWTSGLMEEFRKRRGYDLTPYLPFLVEGGDEEAEGVRYDYHQTLSELILGNFFAPLVDWAEDRGLEARIQAHGAFGDVVRGYGLAHIPEGENIFNGDAYEVNVRHRKLASSAAHLYEKPRVSAETYTWLRMPLFLVTLEMMKAATDAVFLDGINQIVNHGYSYSPPQVEAPGWNFYASTMINHNNLWWRHYPHLTRYIQRTAALLQEGRSINPVALYLPLADVYSRFGRGGVHIDVEVARLLGESLPNRLRRAGYDFDFVNDDALERAVSADGVCRVGTGRYRVLILPGVRYLPVASLERIADFVEKGGAVLALRHFPARAPGLHRLESRQARFHEIMATLWKETRDSSSVQEFGRGRVALAEGEDALIRLLRTMMAPDLELVEGGAEGGVDLDFVRAHLGFLHRRLDGGDLYFLSNISSRNLECRARFDVDEKGVERWDLEGEPRAQAVASRGVRAEGERRTQEVDLSFLPFESYALYFSGELDAPLRRTNLSAPLQVRRGSPRRAALLVGWVEREGEYFAESRLEITRGTRVESLPSPVPIRGTWNLRFEDGYEVETRELLSWENWEGKEAYSGWATYEIEFSFDEERREGLEWQLDLGEVHETAEVRLNGEPLGAAWKVPRVLDCGKHLRTGSNRLRIEVANLWIHQVMHESPPDLTPLLESFGVRWGRYGEVAPTEVPPSGLLGPVILRPRLRVEIPLGP